MKWIVEMLLMTLVYSTLQYLYWIVFFVPDSQPSASAVVVKCLPVGFLAFWTLSR
jgi:hypothetical protein